MKIYTLTLNYTQRKRAERHDVMRNAVLNAGDTYFTLSDIADFLDDVRKIYADVKRLAKLCETVDIELTVAEYKRHGSGVHSNLSQENFDRWTYYGTAENDGIHLDADTRYTTETHDIWMDFAKFDPLHDITA